MSNISDDKRDKLKNLQAKRKLKNLETLKNLPNKKKIKIEEVKEVKKVEKKKEANSDDSTDEDIGFEYNKVTDWKNKQRVLVSSTRGIGARQKYLMMDLVTLLPHSKKENKVEKTEMTAQIKDLCTQNSTNNIMFFEQRKFGRHLYLWMGKYPKGPSVKFTVENIHTTKELKMIGNCLKYSRPLLSFDKSFDEELHLKILKNIFIDSFGAPKNHPKTKPFVDHVFNFSWSNGRIWFRNYQIWDESNKLNKGSEEYELIEIGPRFSLCPIKIFDNFLDGEVLYANPEYISPAMVNVNKRNKMEAQFIKKEKKNKKKEELKALKLPVDELDEIFDNENFVNDDKVIKK